METAFHHETPKKAVLNPTEKSYLRFLPQYKYDIDALSTAMGKNWQPFIDDNLISAKSPEKKAAFSKLKTFSYGIE